MRFCGNCGLDLTLRCLVCGAPATIQRQRVCGECGAALSPPPDTSVRERRLLSVLFCDLVEFTSFSEGRDHEDVRDVLEHYFSAARQTIEIYGGTLEKYIGDAVMALWGAPVAREDDAERAVRAGLDLVVAVQSLRDALAIPVLRVRVGILTGEASVDVSREHEGMVIGDTVNTASRIQSLAAPDSVLVDDVTRVACERSVEFEPGGIHQVKGKKQPIRVWRARRVLARRSGRGRPGFVEPPFVGRQSKLHALKDAVSAVLGDDAGIRLVTVVGDAGLGKTRLAWELEKYVDGIASDIYWHRGQAVAFGEGAGLSALAEMIRTRAGIVADDPLELRGQRLDALLNDLFGANADERTRVRRAIARLLELDDGQDVIARGELFGAWRALFERLAAQRPVVLVFEEMQHAGQDLLDFIVALLEWAEAASILLVLFTRPDERLGDLSARGQSIELLPLAPAEMDQLVTGAVRDPPLALLAAVRDEGGGVPLYAVEALRALADQGTLEVQGDHYVFRGELDTVAVPPTIRALVSSRLDRLEQLERRVLTAGAVLGKRFASPALATLISIDPLETRSLLDGLVQKALLGVERDERSPARGQYFFPQGVLRRVALDTLSRRDRKRLHLAAADYLAGAELEPDRATVLAGHLLAAVDADPSGADVDAIRVRAVATLQPAAERAAAVGATEEALALFDRAIGLVEGGEERARIYERAAILAQRSGLASEAAARFRSAAELHAGAGRERQRIGARAGELQSLVYEQAPSKLLPELRELDAAVGDDRDATAALVGGVLAFALFQCGEHEQALAVATRAIEVAEECGAQGHLLLAMGGQAVALQELDRQVEAIEVYARGLPLAMKYEPRREDWQARRSTTSAFDTSRPGRSRTARSEVQLVRDPWRCA